MQEYQRASWLTKGERRREETKAASQKTLSPTLAPPSLQRNRTVTMTCSYYSPKKVYTLP